MGLTSPPQPRRSPAFSARHWRRARRLAEIAEQAKRPSSNHRRFRRRSARRRRRAACAFAIARGVVNALTDSQLGLLAIAATAVPPSQRGRWLKRIAEQIEPSTPAGAAARRARRRVNTRRWRARLRRGAAVYPVEIDRETFDLLGRVGGLEESKVDDRHAVARALGVPLRRALAALLREAGLR
jgi:hypothetical protein